MANVKTCLWFKKDMKEAIDFYVSLIKNSKVTEISRMPEGVDMPEGTTPPADGVMTMTFELDGTEFMGLQGGPEFTHSEAASIYVEVPDQKEVDRLWNALTSDGGEESYCGWLKDKYGLSWQIIPKQLTDMSNDKNAKKASAAMNAMLQMRKIDVATLQRAYDAA
jgi:predicted 3-demethylubiquinone-9 3-methyltransferase (glyoxalase superfamily)